MSNLFELFESWRAGRASRQDQERADALVEAMKRAERFGALDTASRDAILGYVEQELYR